ncbi:ABC transporter ATP-binding protein [Aquibium sp. A9E412]|uniref:ABC transporter ATP-binding protein n=1 Tax=Aquibium sp. A9E412 TaxID=2976767 RepID=UPI0025B1D426|nr:ABC transporter ATP-binding protein [Aquibium sp. A9E412]MDN2564603.1 ABC transporter ATP-binding protein [Aquibium sp. A9E412]
MTAEAAVSADRVRGPEMIRMAGVHKQFANGTVAVRDMNLTIRQGEFISFLGPSGCGKSTALKMIAGLLSVSAGEITVNGHRPGEQTGGQDTGFVFQEATLMPWATVFDNVFLPLRLGGMRRREARDRVEEALASVGLTRFARAYPRELSGGMKMRVSIARALVTRPRLLLMDEPFAALDEMTRFKLNNDVLKLWERHGLTVIFVTHSVFESVYLSSRVVIMAARPGRVVSEIDLAGDHPRTDRYRNSPAYAENCRVVSAALEETLDHVDIDH